MYSPINCTIILGGFNDWIIESIMENAHESNDKSFESLSHSIYQPTGMGIVDLRRDINILKETVDRLEKRVRMLEDFARPKKKIGR